jgi:peptidoglycan/LPS O-acetylase OafA/YrhL
MASPPGLRTSATYLPELESLRGIAIVLVVLYHADGVVCRTEGSSGIIATPLTAFVRAGHTGVTLFFILSGFLLSLPFLREAAGGKRVRRWDYYHRRALRILPLYFAAVLVASVLTAATAADVLRGIPYLAFLNSFADVATPLLPYSDVWWSLATEVQFYLLLPLLPLCLRSRRGRWFGAATLTVYVVAYASFLRGTFPIRTISGQLALGLSLFGRAPLFLLGMVTAALYLRWGEWLRSWLARALPARGAIAGLLFLALLVTQGCLLCWAAFEGFWGSEIQPFHLWHVIEGALWAAILFCVLLAPPRLKRVFSNRPLGTLGVLSYSIYLLHYPVLRYSIDALRRRDLLSVVGWDAGSYAAMLALLGVCVALSTVTYAVIERPFLKRKARIDR